MGTPRPAGRLSSPSAVTSALLAQRHTDGAHDEMPDRPSIPESLYSLSNSSNDDAVGYFDQHQNTRMQPDLAHGSVDTFLAHIAAERLSRMPHSGSIWDLVLKDAESFASNTSVYQRMLEELGPGHASALSQAFRMLHTLSRGLSRISRHHDILGLDDRATEEMRTAYSIVQNLVYNIVPYCSRGTMSSSTVPMFYQQFGASINDFRDCMTRLVDAIWEHRILVDSAAEHAAINNRTIHSWLAPRDQFIQSLLSNYLVSNRLPEPGCGWFENHLSAFLKSGSNALVVTGRPGCGKSTLFQWMVNRLQMQMLGRSYATISCSINVSTPTESSSKRLVQSLLLQLLDQNVGNMEVFNTLVGAYEESPDHMDLAEPAAWKTLQAALSAAASSQNMVVVIDALDGIIGGEPAALEFAGHVFDVAAMVPTVKIIILSRPFPLEPTEMVERFTITPAQTLNDIERMVDRALVSYAPIQDEPVARRQATVKRIAQSGNGSFLWAGFATELLKKENNTVDGLLRALEKTPTALTHLMQRLVTPLESSPGGIKYALLWLAISLRPLSLAELQRLAGIDARREVLTGTALGSPEDVVRSSAGLLFVDNGIVHFRHSIVQQFVMDMLNQNRMLLPLKDAHRDLTLRLLRAARPESRRFDSPTMDLTQSSAMNEVFRAETLFEYTARYWMIHFSRSSMYRPNGDLALPTDFKKAFPTLVILPIAEGTVWDGSSPVSPDPIQMHKLALEVRLETLNNQSAPVLQSLLNVAQILQRSPHPAEASRYFYQASLLSQTLLGASSSISRTCSMSYLATEGSTYEIGNSHRVSRTEKILKLLLESSRLQYGSNSEDFIKYQTELVQLYTETGDELSAAAALDELHDTVVERYGAYSAEASSINQRFATALRRTSLGGDDTIQYATKLFSLAEQTLDETDDRRLAATLQMIDVHETRQDLARAEELLVNLWSQLTEAHRKSQTPELQDIKFEAAIAYIEFLRRHGRDSEATSLLLGLWDEYEQMRLPSESMKTRSMQLANMLQSTGQSAVALPALISTWNAYPADAKRHSDEAASTAASIAQAILDNQDRSATADMVPSSTSGPQGAIWVVSSSQEAVLREILDLRLSTMPIDQVDGITIQLCDRLSHRYLGEDRPAEAIDILKGVLRLTWPSLMGNAVASTPPKAFEGDAWTLAERLVHCFTELDRFEEAHQVRLSLYEASKASENPDLIARESQSLLQFYNDMNQVDRAIKIHEDLLQRNRKSLGIKHPVTVQALYELASLCDSAGHDMAGKYYQELVSLRDDGSTLLSSNEFIAAVRLSEIYTEGQRWPEVVSICETILRSTDGDGMPGMMTPQTLQTIRGRHAHALSQGNNVNQEILRQAAKRYFDICTKYFPLEPAMLVQAASELAKATESSGAHVFETIPMYERVVQLSNEGSGFSDPTVAKAANKAKTRLMALYRKVALEPSKAPAPMVEIVVAMFFNEYTEARSQHGSSGFSALTALAELVSLYSRASTELYQLSALQALREAVVDIFSSEKSPLRLRESARALAGIYTANGYTEQGLHVVEILRRQVIFKYATKEDGFDLSAETELDRRCYVFIATLEEGLRASEPVSFSDMMSSLLTEIHLFESFTSVEHFDQKLLYGARLGHFLNRNERYDQAYVIENQLLKSFAATFDSPPTPSERSMREFLNRTIEELETDDQAGLARSASIAGESLTKGHIQQQEFLDSYDVAFSAYKFIKSLGAYRDAESIAYGFRLSLFLAGRSLDVSSGSENIKSQMRGLAKTILQHMLSLCQQLSIDLTQMPLPQLKELVGFLDELQSYPELEWLLNVLWSSHSAQKSWSPKDIIWCGKRFVKVRFLRGQQDLAIQLCEDIRYNLTTLWGSLDMKTLEMSVVLSDLYTAVERYQDALAIHEDILRQLLSVESPTGRAEAGLIAEKHVGYLKGVIQRIGKSGADPIPQYSELLETVKTEFGGDTVTGDVQRGSHWNLEGSHNEELFSTAASQQDKVTLISPRKTYRHLSLGGV